MKIRINILHKSIVLNLHHVSFIVVLIVSLFIIFTNYRFQESRNKLSESHMKLERIYPDKMEFEFVSGEKLSSSLTHTLVSTVNNDSNMKYILQWTSSKKVPFVYMGKGQLGFMERNCSFTNCFVTENKSYLNDYTEFDVIAFNGPEISRGHKRGGKKIELPKKRSPRQKYVFASIESAEHYPICTDELDDFFNWTWTYKLNSDSRWGYFVIRDVSGKVVGPKTNMDWLKPEEMMPVSKELRRTLDGKTKAVAWFLSNCNLGRREAFAKRLDTLLEKYGLTVDVYGKCGSLKCDRNHAQECDEMLQKDYLFYLAFENALSEDYVTEKLLHAVKYTTLPIVFTGADLTRFLPPNSYLDARALGVRKLAAKINELARDKDKYAEYFKWVNHYSYFGKSASPDTDDYCGFCTLLNNEDLVKKKSVYKEFHKWWTPDYMC